MPPSTKEFETLAKEVKRLSSFIDKGLDDAVEYEVNQKVIPVKSQVTFLKSDFEKHVKEYKKDMTAMRKKLR